jgi:hypothetical protein
MIKCPKCQFEQPPDTYCANCGINMEVYRPEPKPFLKSLLTNGMFHLLLVIALIVAVVLYDRGKDNSAVKSPQAPVAIRSHNDPVNSPPPEEPAAAPAAAPAVAAATPESAPAPMPEAAPVEVRKKPSTRPGKHSIQVTFYRASRSALADIQRDTQSGNFNGEASGGIISQKKLDQLKANKDLRSLSGNKFKDVDNLHPIMIFKGQRSTTTAKNVGLFFQITPLREEAGSLQLEIKSWGNLKTSGNEENLFVSEMTLNGQAGAFIYGFLPKDKTFTDEEKAVFDTDRTLKIYNNEDFWDGSADLIMVIELTDLPS